MRCALCHEERSLRLSHIVPAFVFRWMKETSGTGNLRGSLNPNVRVQDGLKVSLLCGNCEQIFSDWERQFASAIFHPYRSDQVAPRRYTEWCLKFCVSVSWRVLTYLSASSSLDQLSDTQRRQVDAALDVWREFLLGRRRHPGAFEQHLLPFSEIESTNIPDLPPNFNRFLARGAHMDFMHSDSGFMSTFVKMGPFMLFGFIAKPADKWIGTRVAVSNGTVDPRDYRLPASLFDYLKQKAKESGNVLASLSDNQKMKIQDSIVKNADRIRGSELMKAISADVAMFGEQALNDIV